MKTAFPCLMASFSAFIGAVFFVNGQWVGGILAFAVAILWAMDAALKGKK